MPGFILHITTAKMLFHKYHINIDPDAFAVGNLIPDSVSDKTFSHFRHPDRNKKLIVYPDLELFLKKYSHLMHDSSCLGYYFHLYIDRIYAIEYFPQIVTFYDSNGHEASDRADITHAYIKRTGEYVPIQTFFSDEYYYGDFTKLNTYLMNRFQLSINLNNTIKNPGIEEVDYTHISSIKQQLQDYLNVSEEAVQQLKVFEPDHFLHFLEKLIDEFVLDCKEKNIFICLTAVLRNNLLR